MKDRDDLREILKAIYPNEKPKTLIAWECQLWPFARVMSVGDPIVMPLKQRSGFALGHIKGIYQHTKLGDEWLHVRQVEWVREVPRATFAQDLQHSYGAALTVFQVYRNDAETRVSAVLLGKPDPAFSGSSMSSSKPAVEPVVGVAASEASDAPADIEQYAEDAIRLKVATVFKGHRLSALIGALLECEGYRVVVSPPGADGGVDILAGKGPLGFDPPRLVVQVKSQDSAIDVSVLRELQGVMRQFNADQGLLVAWGGVTKALAREAQRLFFEIRIWDSGDLIKLLRTNYENLPEEIKADLPLKRIWTLAVEG